MKTSQILKNLGKYQVFNADMVKSIIKKNASYTHLFIYRLKKSGHIFQIERNKYTVHKNTFLIASFIVWPSYISLWSALRYYNFTEQIPHAVWVVTPRKKRKKIIKYCDSEIFFVFTKPKYFFGFKKINFSGFEIFIAEPEKAIIDSLLFKKISFLETYSIIKNNIKTIKIKKLIEFALKTKNKALIKRTGFVLDSLGHDYYKMSEKYIYPVFTPLEYKLSPKGKKNGKWKVIENVVL